MRTSSSSSRPIDTLPDSGSGCIAKRFAPITIRWRTPSSTGRASSSRTVGAPDAVAADDERSGISLAQRDEGGMSLAVAQIDAKLPASGRHRGGIEVEVVVVARDGEGVPGSGRAALRRLLWSHVPGRVDGRDVKARDEVADDV